MGTLAAASLLLVAACGSDDDASSEDTSSAQSPDDSNGDQTADTEPATTGSTSAPSDTEPSDDIARGGTLRIAQTEVIQNLDPSQLVLGVYGISPSLFNTLISLTDSLEPQPELATEWSWSDDLLQLTMTLRDDVTFHDGTPLTADDVVWNVDWYLNPETAAHMRGLLSTIESAEALDPQTVVLNFAQPSPTIFDALDLMFIVKPGEPDDIKTSPIGTGPFVFESFTPGTGVVLTRNDAYWEEGLPYLDQVEVMEFPDAQTALVNLEGDSVDVLMQPPWRDFGRLGEEGYVTGGSPPEVKFAVLFNTTVAPYDNPLVRQAVSWALDRDRMMELAVAGNGEPQCLPWATESAASDPAIEGACVQDLERAEQLLAEAGVEDLSINLLASSQRYPESVQIAEIVQANLAEIGVDVQIENVDSAVHIERMNNGEYEVSVSRYGRSNRNPSTLFGGAKSHIPATGFTLFTSPEYERLVGELSATDDPAELRDLYTQMNELLMTEQFAITLGGAPFVFATSPDVHGFDYTLGGMADTESAWIG